MPYPPVEQGAENCPLGLDWHIEPPNGSMGPVCGPGTRLAALPGYDRICDFNMHPIVAPDHIHLINQVEAIAIPGTGAPTNSSSSSSSISHLHKTDSESSSRRPTNDIPKVVIVVGDIAGELSPICSAATAFVIVDRTASEKLWNLSQLRSLLPATAGTLKRQKICQQLWLVINRELLLFLLSLSFDTMRLSRHVF